MHKHIDCAQFEQLLTLGSLVEITIGNALDQIDEQLRLIFIISLIINRLSF
jgi:hypothetical protein